MSYPNYDKDEGKIVASVANIEAIRDGLAAARNIWQSKRNDLNQQLAMANDKYGHFDELIRAIDTYLGEEADSE